MNGAEHYREAERLLAIPVSTDAEDQGAVIALHLAAAAHALLALVASNEERAGFVLSDADVMRCAHGAVICGLCGYGVNAGDGGR